MKIEIIPAIDMIGGECVRLTQGDYDQKTSYFKDPSEVARRYEDLGVRRLHLVDLDGAKASRPQNLRALEKIASVTSLDIQYGGGIKSAESLRSVLDSGANRAICGSIAVTDPDAFASWLETYGADHVILGADTKGGRIAINGWKETAGAGVEELIDRFRPLGLTQVICTDISKDGMLQGPTFDLYDRLQRAYPEIDITVSGGISRMEDIERLNDMQLRSVIVGKAIYEKRITPEQIRAWIEK